MHSGTRLAFVLNQNYSAASQNRAKETLRLRQSIELFFKSSNNTRELCYVWKLFSALGFSSFATVSLNTISLSPHPHLICSHLHYCNLSNSQQEIVFFTLDARKKVGIFPFDGDIIRGKRANLTLSYLVTFSSEEKSK